MTTASTPASTTHPAAVRQSLWFARAERRERPTPDPFRAHTHYDVVVVGAGITGLTTALLLARAGLTVCVLEARRVGAATTGNTTAKVSLLQGSRLQTVLRHRSVRQAQAYVEANLEGRDWLLRYCDDHSIPYERQDAVTYATTHSGAERVRKEHEAARMLGLPVVEGGGEALPFATTAAITLGDQAQLDPLEVLDALVSDVQERGGVVHENARVTTVSTRSPVAVTTSLGEVTADRVVVATAMPVLERGLHSTRLVPQRSYALAYRIPGVPPEGMFLSLDDPARSLRTAEIEGERLLLVGGNGHGVGRTDSEQAAIDDLEQWTRQHFPGAARTHSWSAQDPSPVGGVPQVGRLPFSRGRVHVAAGYEKWGMTNAVAAALAISGDILGGQMEWARTLYRHGPSLADVGAFLGAGAAVARHLAKGWWGALSRPVPDPAEGQGAVGLGAGLRPTAVSRVDGVDHRVSAVCPHMGGILSWNDAEKSWDCPLHGSRFSAAGACLEGPAVRDLRRMP